MQVNIRRLNSTNEFFFFLFPPMFTWMSLDETWIVPELWFSALGFKLKNKMKLSPMWLSLTLELSFWHFCRADLILILAILEATHPISATTLVAICQTKVACLAITEIWVGWGTAMIGDVKWAVPGTTTETWRECGDFKLILMTSIPWKYWDYYWWLIWI